MPKITENYLAEKIAQVELQPIEFDATHEVYATHEGEMNLFGHPLKIYQLNTGERVIDTESFERFLNQVINPTENA